jgi:hypothetical protein
LTALIGLLAQPIAVYGVACTVALADCAFAQEAEMKPFAMNWQDNSGSPADVASAFGE